MDAAGAPVASGDRASWQMRTGAWIGVGTGPGAMMVGAGVAGAIGTARAIPAVVLGCGAIYWLGVRHGLEGFESRAPMGEGVARIFGAGIFAAIFTGVVLLAMVGWCGFYVGIGGAAVSDLTATPQPVGAAVMATVCLVLALLGQDKWNGMLYLTAGSAVALTLITVTALPAASVPQSVSGWIAGDVITGLGGVIAYAIVFTMRTPDFTMDLVARRDVWIAGLTMFVPMVVLMSVGIWVYGSTGLYDMAGVLGKTDRPAAGQLFLALSAIAPAVTAIYSSAISFDSIKRVPHKIALTAGALLAFGLGAARFDLRLLGFLQSLGAFLPPALAVMLLHPHLHPAPAPTTSFVAFVLGCVSALSLRVVAPFWGFLAGFAVTSTILWIGREYRGVRHGRIG
jgi:cytosine permease